MSVDKGGNTFDSGDHTPPPLNDSIGSIRARELQRKNLIGRLFSCKNAIAELNSMSSHQLEVKLNMLERQFETFELIQSELEMLDESQFNENHRSVVEDAYFDIKPRILELLAAQRVINQDSMLSSTRFATTPPSSSQRSHLPSLQLSKFSGQHKDWLDFYNMFCALVHNNTDLSALSKFQYLRSCLTDNAARLIHSLEVTSDNYERALNLLVSRYDNKRYIFQSHMQNIFDIHKVNKPNVASIRDFIDSTNANLRALESIATKVQVADGILLHMIVSKLDVKTQSKWEEEISLKWDNSNSSPTLNLPSWEDLASFLERRCKMLDIVECSGGAPKQTSSYPQSQRNRSMSSLVVSNQYSKCSICNTSPFHGAFRCHKFIEMDVPERFKTVKHLKLCLNCMGSNHIASNCPSLNRCQHCQAAHHTLLHRETSTSPDASTPANSPPNTVRNVPEVSLQSLEPTVALKVSHYKSQVLLGTARVQLCASSGVTTVGRAMLDSGSQLHFITERMAQFLQLHRKKTNLEICGIGTKITNTHHTCSLSIRSLTNGFSSTIDAVILPTITSYQPQHSINITDWPIPENIPLADVTFNQPGPVDLLIGADLFYDVLLVGQIKIDDGPILQKTKLGWTVSGTAAMSQSLHHTLLSSTQSKLSSSSSWNSQSNLHASTSTSSKSHVNILSSNPKYNTLLCHSNEMSLDKLLEKFWILENCVPDSCAQLTSEELECERWFAETTRRCPITGKFIVRLPFKDSPTKLGQSVDIARTRFLYLENKFARDDEIHREYSDFMHEYINLGHMVPVSSSDTSNYNYIPHHCVLKPDSSTTRLRVVFDASCRTSNGTSINDLLRVGPTLQDDIFTILSRFRYHKYVLVADIAKMYRQVLVDPEDTVYQCIMWRNNKGDPLNTYHLQTVTYGTSCAPYLAVKCLQKLADDESKELPMGAAVTLKDFYVDNLMTGGKTIGEVIEIKDQVVELLNRGGFPLRKFASNSETILADIPHSERETVVQVDDMEYVKTLGLKWSPAEDCFSFAYSQQQQSSKVSKRGILAQVASFFDPLGLLNPIIVVCKILLQNLWTLKLHWDESVPQNVNTQWIQIRKQLELISQIKIPRFVSYNLTTNIHAFADASTKAYGACIYAVTMNSAHMQSSLLCAKSRVAPLKDVSLPRLELCAALLLSELLQTVLNCCPSPPQQVCCWSDSTITLAWIKAEPSRWNTFVANRVSKIQQHTSNAKWFHVPSELNPADILSRGSTVSGISNNSLWFNGPEFLLMGQEFWPAQEFATPDELCEVRKQQIVLVVNQSEILLCHHKFINNYDKLIRIFAYVQRFINITRKKECSLGPISVEEMSNALSNICRIIQRSAFTHELECLRSAVGINQRSRLRALSPFLHESLIRVGGRLVNSTLPFAARHPILLPSSHPFVRTLIRHFHHQHMHAGALTLHNIIRDQFWIINGRNAIKQVLHNCILCYKCRPITESQVMGALPTERVEPSFPFQISGVDYCGPFAVTQKIRGRSPIKMYISVFICFSTKAVHLELVPDLTTAAFISALKRFIARRGRCSTIYSDNATNFVGANRELRELLKSFLSEQHNNDVHKACQQEGISWRFIPPRSPHFGGLWESAVKQAKYYLRRSIGTHVLTTDELHTVCCQAEAIINSRPLSPMSSDPDDLRPLTPAHFLVGRNLTAIAEPSILNVNTPSLKRYQLSQWIHQHFWDRWRQEYLKTLQQKTKWTVQKPNLQPNDLVLLKDENAAPLKWPIGRVVEISPGEDGQVRVVTVKTAQGAFKRAITKLCKLPLETQS